MNVTESSPNTKQRQSGFKKLWTKVKAAMSGEPAKPQYTMSTSTETTPKRAAPVVPQYTMSTSTETTPKRAAPVVPVLDQSISTEPATIPKPEIVKEIETPEAVVYSVPREQVVKEDSRPVIPVPDAIEVDETEDSPDTFELPVFKSRNSESANKHKFDQAQAMYQKYGIPLDITDWRHAERPGVDRIEKKTRMRVRYTCHSCQNVFGRDKICSRCSHDRGKCLECVRYPAKRTGQRARTEKVVLIEPMAPSITRGACHECKTDFTIGDRACQNCEHNICERCLRETVLDSHLTAPPPPHSQRVAV